MLKMKIVVAAIAALLCLMGIAVGNMPSVEQRLISFDANNSSGNLTGDDYVILLVDAYIVDYNNTGDPIHGGPEYDQIYKMAKSQFPEYSKIYNFDGGIGTEIEVYVAEKSAQTSFPRSPTTGGSGKKEFTEFMETHKTELIGAVLAQNSRSMNDARVKVQKRLDMESRQRIANAHRKALQQEAEKQREVDKQTEAAKHLCRIRRVHQ